VKIGIFGFNIGPTSEPDLMTRVLRTADEAGYEPAHRALPDDHSL